MRGDAPSRSEANEIKSALIMTGIATEEVEVEFYTKKIDKGGDGTVSESEFLEFMANQFLNAKNMRNELDLTLDRARPRPRTPKRTADPRHAHPENAERVPAPRRARRHCRSQSSCATARCSACTSCGGCTRARSR